MPDPLPLDSSVRMYCECGREHAFDRDTKRVSCDCGSVYAVSITQLVPPEA